MAFQDNLAAMSDISRLSGLDVCGENGGVLHHIPAAPGKLGSLKLYNALAERFGGILDGEAAEQGLDGLPSMLPTRRPIRANIRTSTCCSK